MPTTTPKLVDIATRICVHFSSHEQGTLIAKFFPSQAWVSGNRIGIKCSGSQREYRLTELAALHYLAWLDAGNHRQHYYALSGKAVI